MDNSKNNTLVIDLDNTITIQNDKKSYEEKSKNTEVIKTINKAKNDGYNIFIYTSRNMRTYNCDIDLIHQYTKPIALKWLEENGVHYDEIKFGKPWVGFDGNYIDDKNLHIEEFNFKYGSVYSDYRVDVLVSFYNEEGNVFNVHTENKKLERLFNINQYIYVNNSSKDNTYKELIELQNYENKLKVVNVEEDLGYGNGFKNAFQNSTADFIITNHGDGQFNAYLYFLNNLKKLSNNKDLYTIFPQRVHRPHLDAFLTLVLRNVLSIKLNRKIFEFNGQPKLINVKDINSNIQNFPNDFSFDLCLYASIEDSKKLYFPIIQEERDAGESSWNTGIKSKFNLFLKYLKTSTLIKREQL